MPADLMTESKRKVKDANVSTKDERHGEIDVEAPQSRRGQNRTKDERRAEVDLAAPWPRAALGAIGVVAAICLIVGLSVGLTRGNRGKEYEDELCLVPRYEPQDVPATCEALMGDNGHTNSYWTNENFLCRTNERPCEATAPVLDMNLRNGMTIMFDKEQYDFGPAEVWHIRTDRRGESKTTPWSSPYQFYSEGRWVTEAELNWNGDFNDYLFNSLECKGRQDDDDFVFIVIDGVLVDSCPKKLAEECRFCASSECAARKWHYSSEIVGCTNTKPGNEQVYGSLRDCCLYHFGTAICTSYDECTDFGDYGPLDVGLEPDMPTHYGKRTCIQDACGAPYYEPNPPSTCKVLTAQDDHTNSYWTNEKFLCRTNERPCEATSSVLEMNNLPGGMKITIDMDSDLYDFGPAEVWHVRTNRNGEMKVSPWSSPYRFFSENRWVHHFDKGGVGEDFNDYLFGSLECSGPQDDDDFVFIVVDGVLVDSCPKGMAKKCRVCGFEC